MRIVGIDASLTGTGIAVIDTGGLEDLVYTFTIKSRPDDNTISGRHQRLANIATVTQRYLDGVDVAVIEAPALSRNTGHVWDRAGLWWLIIDYANAVTPIVQVTPSQLKKFASGKGNADKTAVAAAMTRLWDNVEPANDNEFDALALATVGAVHLDPEALPFTILERHKATVDAIDWPKTGVAA